MAQRWRAALVAYSAAVSVKMNVLLMAPPVLVVMLQVPPRCCCATGVPGASAVCFARCSHAYGERAAVTNCCVGQGARLQEVAEGAILGVLLQLLLGAPFLLRDAGAYMSRAFELSRCSSSGHSHPVSGCGHALAPFLLDF